MNLIARIFALSLVVTGAAASTQIHNNINSDVRLGAAMGMIPPAVCAPNEPGACGMGQ